MRMHILVIALLACCLLTACNGRDGLLPKSGGRPCEIVVVGDVDSTVYRILSTDMPGLPQAEPLFDVDMPHVEPSEAERGVLRYSRLMLTVDIDSTRFSRTAIKYRRNIYAEPQTVVRITSPSAAAMRRDLPAQQLREFLYKEELSMAQATLQQKHNKKMEATVKRMFGAEMLIPADMTSCKQGKNFLWISNNSPTSMLNICIYSHDFSKRDSVMRVNIKGETDSMYMTTVHDACQVKYDCTGAFVEHDWRGLWEMKGDAMGGPLVARTIFRGLNRNTPVTIEGFVYAPGVKKRNLVMQLEAVLQTIKAQNKAIKASHKAAIKNNGLKPIHID